MLKVEEFPDYYKYDVSEMAVIVEEMKSYEVQKDLIRKSHFVKIFMKKNV